MRSAHLFRTIVDFAANLLGVVGLAVADRIEKAALSILGRAGEAPAAVVVIGYGLGPSNEQLRRILGLSHPGSVRLVDRLVDDGLVERREGPDKRSIALYLTKRGKDFRQKLLKERLAAVRPLLVPLTKDEQEKLAELLHKLLTSMDTTDLERCNLCRLCDDRVCINCPIPANFRSARD